MENDLITIVVPIYNVELYLENCIVSIINQTYKNIEVILVDDGSTDNSGKIADKYAKNDNRIKVFHKENGGLSDARNFGIKKAKGKYICFVDSDDFIDAIMIETLYKLNLKFNTKISVGNFLVFNNLDKIKKNKKDDGNVVIYNKIQALKELFSDKGFGNYAWNKMYDIKLFDDIQYPKGKKMEDLGTTYKLFLKCENICYTDQVIYYYYQRENSILHTFDKRLFRDKVVQANERFFDLKKISSLNYENEKYLLDMYMECLPYIYDYKELYEKCKKVIRNNISTEIKRKLTFNKKIKYFIFNISDFLFCKMFGGK